MKFEDLNTGRNGGTEPIMSRALAGPMTGAYKSGKGSQASPRTASDREIDMGDSLVHGWVSLPTRGEAYLEHGVPRRASVAGDAPVDVGQLAEEITDMTGLRVTLGTFEPGEEPGQLEAGVDVSPQDLNEVLGRLAQASAEVFYDRYRKPIDAEDTDFDDEAFAQDLGTALEACRLHWGEVDEAALRERYRLTLHSACEEIARRAE
jgi:hypothetical protein